VPVAWDSDAEVISAGGHHVLAVNYRRASGPGALAELPPSREEQVADVCLALRWVTEQLGVASARIVLVGSSYGASLVLDAIVTAPRLAGSAVLVSTARPGSHRAEEVIRFPVRAFHGGVDPILGADGARAAIEQTLGVGVLEAPDGRFVVFEDEGHYFQRLEARAEVLEAVFALLKAAR
jgi:pimeloyl-ACP methyl ester carboxylesterase